MLFRQPSLCGHPWHCAGWPVSTLWRCATHSCTASTSRPLKEDGGTLERGTDVNPAPARDGAVTSDQWSASPPSPPALCGHPRRRDTIPGTIAPSPVLWEPGATRHCHSRCCASYDLSSVEPSSQRTDGDRTGSPHATTLEAALGRVQDSPRRWPGARFVRTTVNSATLYAMTPYVALRTMRHDCKPPPLEP
jgi:hypothetical protein